MKNLENFELDSWDAPIPASLQQKVIKALENGKVVYFPRLAFNFKPHELSLLSPDKTDPKSKNISYDIRSDKLGGYQCSDTEAQQLKEMIKRYSTDSRKLLEKLFPSYVPHLTQARTSFRPVEIEGRKSSYRKDDTLLHVDSFSCHSFQRQPHPAFFHQCQSRWQAARLESRRTLPGCRPENSPPGQKTPSRPVFLIKIAQDHQGLPHFV